MPSTTATAGSIIPVIDLESCTKAAFDKWLVELAQVPTPTGPDAYADGWSETTPEGALALYRRTGGNRKTDFITVKKYYREMKKAKWVQTGQPILITESGKLVDAHHRLLAQIAAMATIKWFIIASVPDHRDLFAFIDNSKPRSNADALYTGGENGQALMMASTIEVAWRWDRGALSVRDKQPVLAKPTQIEALDYSREHPSMRTAIHFAAAECGRAISIVGKGALGFFAWKAIEATDETTVASFLRPLGTGANLDEDSPILAARNRFMQAGENEEKLNPAQRLALLIKAFNMFLAGQAVSRKGLFLRDNERFPRIEVAPAREAAE